MVGRAVGLANARQMTSTAVTRWLVEHLWKAAMNLWSLDRGNQHQAVPCVADGVHMV